MKALLILIAVFAAFCILRGLAAPGDVGKRERRTPFERVADGFAAVNAYGKYLFWIAIAIGIAYALLILPAHL